MSNALESRESISLFVLGERLGQAEFSRYLAELDRCIERGTPFAMIVDGSSPKLEIVELPPRSWQRSRATAIAKLHRGVAFVAGGMTHDRVRALYALQPPGVLYGFFASVDEAREWARGALEGTSVSVMSQRKTQPLMSVVRGS
ncbi:MAG: hypothetical protein R6X02_30400 [Enhygromyxa sp.]